MAKITPFLPVTADTLSSPGQPVPNWFQNFLHQYNVFGNSVGQGITGSLVSGDNIAGVRYPTTGLASFKTGPNYSTGVFQPISFLWTAQTAKGGAPDEVRIGTCSAQNGSIGTTPVGIPSGGWSYSASTNLITISMITGLSNSTSYYLSVIAQ